MNDPRIARMLARSILLAGVVGSMLAPVARAADIAAAARGFVSKYCAQCHDSTTKEGRLDITSLSSQLDEPHTFDAWVTLFDKVDKQEMPPPEEEQPDAAARAGFVRMLHDELQAANSARQRTEGRVVLRRLNRVEYEHTLQDLLAIDLPLEHYLPADASAHGFDNVSEALRLSMLHMEQYLEAADAAISAAVDLRAKPAGINKRMRYHDEESVKDDIAKQDPRKDFRVSPDAVVIFDANLPSVLRQWLVPDRGRYRIKISAAAFQAAGRPIWLKLYATDFKVDRLLGYFDLPADKPREMEVFVHLDPGTLLKLSPFDTNYDDQGQGLWGHDANTYAGRGVAIQGVEVEGPLLDRWPPQSVGRLFGDLPVRPIEKPGSQRGAPAFAIAPDDPRAAVEPTVRNFASRAFRRPVTSDEVERYVKLANQGLDDGQSFDDALRVAFRAVLTSPRFLFFEEQPGRLDDWALASRLSYFLWSTLPDDELRQRANEGRLREPAELRSQVERMLASPKAESLVENFVGQWLELRQIDFTQPDRKLYPEFDDLLKAAMLGETHAFFAHMLKDDLPLSNFVDSDFAMLNRSIAEHYQIAGVTGEEFRPVPLPAGSHRGGVMTQASVLKVTANGTASSPVIRGAWIARRLLGEPPPPPPADVPAFEPDTRGATTIRQQLAQHRSQAICASCHARMDPAGFALENFDVIGGWRDRYRAEKGDAPAVMFRGRRVWEYKLGPTVDASGELADGRKFANIDEFKQILLARQDQVARNLTRSLLTYATGAGIQFADREVVEEILARVKAQKGGLRTLIHEVVASPTFQTK